jgi:signal transduction histidine kinase
VDAETHPALSGIDPEVVATFAHEIRNILSPLSMSAELLNVPTLDEASLSQAKGVVCRQVRQLRRLVNDLLDVHRLECQQLYLTLKSTDLTKAVEAICNDHRGLFVAQGISLLTDLAAEPVWIEVDLDRIEQVLNNLLSNSLKFTDRGGQVRVGISVDVEHQSVVISVRDTGVGIEPTLLDGIFKPLAHELSYRNRSGLGLGLPLSKRLIELHGGHLIAHSQGDGKGSEFCILLPLPSVALRGETAGH